MGLDIPTLVRPGKVGLLQSAARLGLRKLLRFRTRHAPVYRAPGDQELREIEAELEQIGIPCGDLVVDPGAFETAAAAFPFPPDYYGGSDAPVHREKLLEHYVAWTLLGLDGGNSPYLDIAACSSPWASILRERGIDAHAVDLEVPAAFAPLGHYHRADATDSGFSDGQFAAASLQCAYEMFRGDADTRLLAELGRILKPGGKAVISPLYMHTHACHYQTPEYFLRASIDAGAKAYLRPDCWGIPGSRKYSPRTLRERVWDPALAAGLSPRLLVLRNKAALGPGIYLHFILVLERAATDTAAGGTP